MRREEEDGERKERLKIVREVAKIGCVVFWKRCPIWGDDGIGRVGGQGFTEVREKLREEEHASDR